MGINDYNIDCNMGKQGKRKKQRNNQQNLDKFNKNIGWKTESKSNDMTCKKCRDIDLNVCICLKCKCCDSGEYCINWILD